MKILAIEFSSEQRSVAVLQNGTDETPARLCSAVEAGSRHTHAFALIEQALRGAGLEREQIECVAVGLGPGSYTGIRMAISIAQGWKLARGLRLLGISSVECLAAQAQSENILGCVHVVIDAQRNEFYLATYDITDAVARVVEPLRLATLVEVQARIKIGGMVAEPEVVRSFPRGRILFPHAAALANLAATRTDFVTGEKLEPIYLRETSFVKAPLPRVIPAV